MPKLFLILLFFHSFAWANSPKTEVELKINLTQEGYTHLKNVFKSKYDPEASSRTDIYFDIFKENSYYLKNLAQPIKLRLMTDSEETKWQVQRTLETSTQSIFSVKKTQSLNDIVSPPFSLKEIQAYHEKLLQNDIYALALAKTIQAKMNEEDIFEFTATHCQECKITDQYFSTHFNKKKRLKIKLKLKDDNYTLQLGETENQKVITYELEAEVKGTMALKDSAVHLEEWLKSEGFNLTHINQNPAIDSTSITEEALKKF
jgi:hypothetical protein